MIKDPIYNEPGTAKAQRLLGDAAIVFEARTAPEGASPIPWRSHATFGIDPRSASSIVSGEVIGALEEGQYGIQQEHPAVPIHAPFHYTIGEQQQLDRLLRAAPAAQQRTMQDIALLRTYLTELCAELSAQCGKTYTMHDLTLPHVQQEIEELTWFEKTSELSTTTLAVASSVKLLTRELVNGINAQYPMPRLMHVNVIKPEKTAEVPQSVIAPIPAEKPQISDNELTLKAAAHWFRFKHQDSLRDDQSWYEHSQFTFGGNSNLLTTSLVHALEGEKLALNQDATHKHDNHRFRYRTEEKAKLHLILHDMLEIIQASKTPILDRKSPLTLDSGTRSNIRPVREELKGTIARIALLDTFMEARCEDLRTETQLEVEPQNAYAFREQLKTLAEGHLKGSAAAMDILSAQKASSALTRQFAADVEKLLGKPLFVHEDNVAPFQARR
jgi:hypothetical protein